MAQAVGSTSTFPRGRIPQVFTGSVERWDTTARDLFTLKAGDIPLALQFYSTAASNAGTSGRVSIGSTSNSTFFSVGIEVKSGVQSTGPSIPSSATNLGVPLSFDTIVQGTYAQDGSAATSGGPWVVVMTVLTV